MLDPYASNGTRPAVADHVQLSKSRHALAIESWHEFELEQKVFEIEGGQSHIRLTRPLRLRLNLDTFIVEVIDWEVSVAATKLVELPKLIVRRFLELFSAAEVNALTSEERRAYIAISDYVDFRQLTIERAPPRYLEGEILAVQPNVVVEWHDGSTERLKDSPAKALSDLIKGDKFSAWVKLGLDNQSLSLERVKLLRLPAGPTAA